jgi:hypothetical protein
MTKTILTNKDRTFDLKFLFVGDSGAGKTHFCGTYTLGPVHFYMTDPGGEKTLHKINQNRPKGCEISIDVFNPRSTTFSAVWATIQKDEKDGFFTSFAERNGLVVLPDSLTSLNSMILQEVVKKNNRSLLDESKAMRIQDWGQLIQWIKAFVGVINDLPCAVAATAHLQTETGESGQVQKRYPNINGRYATSIGVDFDEVYLLEAFGKKRRIYFTERNLFSAKSRVFSNQFVEDITLDDLAKAYMSGKTEL